MKVRMRIRMQNLSSVMFTTSMSCVRGACYIIAGHYKHVIMLLEDNVSMGVC